MAEKYYVTGGLYKDTSFSEFAEGQHRMRVGPFDTYDEAKAVWRGKAMETVDEAYVRFSIELEEPQEFWVVGGSYTETDFKTPKSGEEEHIGPFETEGPTIERLHAEIAAAGHRLSGKHHEVYLSDIRRAAPENWRTILRQPFSP